MKQQYILRIAELSIVFLLSVVSWHFHFFFISLDRYQKSDLVKLDVLLNGQPVDAMATIVHNLKAQRVGRELVDKLKKLIDRQMFDITIQAAIGSKVVARET